jgi:hypothetical protein
VTEKAPVVGTGHLTSSWPRPAPAERCTMNDEPRTRAKSIELRAMKKIKIGNKKSKKASKKVQKLLQNPIKIYI